MIAPLLKIVAQAETHIETARREILERLPALLDRLAPIIDRFAQRARDLREAAHEATTEGELRLVARGMVGAFKTVLTELDDL